MNKTTHNNRPLLFAEPLTGLLLAGGQGTRFDPSGQADKLMASLKGEPIAVHAARLMRHLCRRSFAVLGPDKPALRARLEHEGLLTLVDARVQEGLGGSLAAGVSAILARGQPQALAVMLADMPVITPRSLHTLARAWQCRRRDIGAAALFYQGQRGHPVIFDGSLLPQLTALSGDRGAGRLLESVTVLRVEVDDPGILRDVDTPEDLSRIREACHDAPRPI